jgi:hypothetical protein
MRKMPLIFFLIPFLLGKICFAQDPGCWSPPQVLQQSHRTVCYICRLTYKPFIATFGFPICEPKQRLTFEIVKIGCDPFAPGVIELEVPGDKYPGDFFEVGKIYTVVAEYSREIRYSGRGLSPEHYPSCFMPMYTYSDHYDHINIATIE